MSTAVAVQESKALTPAMVGLAEHVECKRMESESHLNEMQSALDKAIRCKWQTQPLRNAVRTARKWSEYWQKVSVAIAAGYIPMPAVNCEAFAVRISDSKRLPPWARIENPRGWDTPGDHIDLVQSDAPPVGEGEYVDTSVMFVSRHGEYSEKDDKTGERKIVKYRVDEPTDFISELSFPMVMARPAIMDATERAMAMRVFDDMAISPNRGVRKADPIIIGRIKKPRQYADPLHFVIAWDIRPQDLE